ncbi:MAG: hypothetical protein WDM81_03740 [Rhizomicrobium sp.]
MGEIARLHGVEQQRAGLEHRGVDFALGQRGGSDGGEGVKAGERLAALHHVAGAGLRRLDGEIAEMLVQPRPPMELHAVAGLEHGFGLARRAAAHEAQMAGRGYGSAFRGSHSFRRGDGKKE